MNSYELKSDEVILYKSMVVNKEFKGNLYLTLTSKKIFFEREKGIFKKEREIVDLIPLETIKFYSNEAQIKQKGTSVEIQTIQKNILLSFSGIIEARKFISKIINAVTGTTMAERGSNKVKDAINILDDTLGVDTRGALKGLVESGVTGTLLNGIKKKK